MNYRSYGDFVQYAKVEPSPVGTDYGITEMKAVGQNSTLFTRTLESISTRATSTASLTFYDTGLTVNTDDMSNINVQAISGTFQMIYDGEETAIMQASASAADMAEAIAGISTVGIAPTVTKTFSTGYSVAATDKVDGPHSNADVTHSLSVTWTIEFSAKSGDAKKLTFKYTDTIGTERQASTVLSSTGVALTNTVAGTSGAEYTEFAKNNIVMQYLNEGSTFFDALLTSSAAGTAAAAAASVHDELAADVTVGSTFDVKSSEQFMMFFFDEITAAPADVDAKMCVAAVQAKIIFEYDGEFSAPTAICATSANFATDLVLATALNTLSGVANGLVNVEGHTVTGVTDAGSYGAAGVNRDTVAAVKDTFNTHFPWGATATGSAHGMIKVTLPLGLDGNKFRMHLQTFNGKQLGLGSTSLAGQVYVHRARNNNGRTFEVTQAYENKVAGATTFSKVNGVTQEATILGSGFGSLVATDGSGVDATKYIPGTYYNVRLLTDATHDSSGTGRGVFVKVVVGVGAIKHVEVTAGGIGVVPGEKLVIGCDTRIHPDFNDCDGTADVAKHARVTFGAASEVLATNNVLGIGMRVGAVASAVADGSGGGAVAAFCIVGTTGTRFEPATNAAGAQKILGTQLSTKCAAGTGLAVGTLTAATVTHPGVTDVGEDAIDTAANADAHPVFVIPGSTFPQATFAKGDMNLFYYQAGFYDTVTPQFYVDALHAGALEGGDVMKAEMMTVMGGRQDRSYLYTSYVGGDDLQIFGGLKDVAWQGAGAGRRVKTATLTSSLTVGRQGQDLIQSVAGTFAEHMDKYAYIGRGVDQLTVTPQPDAMTGKKLEA